MINYDKLKNLFKAVLNEEKFCQISKKNNKIFQEEKSISSLDKIPNSKMMIYCCSDFISEKYFDYEEEVIKYLEKIKEYDNISVYDIIIYEYLGDFRGQSDVIRKTIIGKLSNGEIKKYDKKKKSIMISVSDLNEICIYNERKSINLGEFV